MTKLLLFLTLVGVASAVDYKQGNDCDELKCNDRPGTVCQMVTTNCFTAPCPPSAYCVPRANSCETKKCARGLQCIVKLPLCSSDAPCDHVPTCLRIPRCGVNEEYRECNGEGDSFEASCKNEYPYSPGCGTGGCVCKFGFVRDAARKCIKKEQCPDPECPPNQMWNKCPGTCNQPTCRSILAKPEKCSKECGWAQCTCKPGFVKNDDDVCIKRETCPKKFDCESSDEVKVQCSKQCEPSCFNRDPVCSKKCGPPKCQCKPGFMREGPGFCLSSQQCPHIDPIPHFDEPAVGVIG